VNDAVLVRGLQGVRDQAGNGQDGAIVGTKLAQAGERAAQAFAAQVLHDDVGAAVRQHIAVEDLDDVGMA